MKKICFFIILTGIINSKTSFSACETSTTAPGCTTSKGLIASPNTNNNLYNFVEPSDFITIKTRSKVFDLNEFSESSIVENLRVRRDISLRMTFRKDPATKIIEACDYIKSLYMMLTIANEKD